MRKITKALALALCICLLSGVAAFVFAAPGDGDPTSTQLNITNDTHNIVNDFNFSSEDYQNVYMPTGGDPQKQIQGLKYEEDYDTAGQKRGMAAAGAASHLYPVAPYQVPTDSADGNGYLLWVKNAENTAKVSTGNAEPIYWLSDYRHDRKTYNLAYVDGYDFVTVDFEFGYDRYTYTIDGVSYTGSEVPANADPGSAKLAAVDAPMPVYFTTYYRGDRDTAFNSSSQKANNAGFNVINGPDGLLYASMDTVYDEADVRLSNEVGVFDHVTFVLKLVKDGTYESAGGNTYDYYKTVKYFYVNGKLVGYYDVPKQAGYDAFCLGRLGFAISKGQKNTDSYALAFDDIATNWYPHGYEYGENSLLDFFGEDFDASASLYECDDVVYQENYVTHNTERWIEVDGVKYYNINAGLDAIANGSDVVVNANINYFAPSQSLVEFNLELVGGSDFEISKGIYTFTPNGANSYKVEQSSAMANLALVDGIKFSLYVDAENGTIKSVSGVEEATFVWDSVNNCYEIIWAAELDSFETNPVKIYYSEGDSLVCNEVILDISEYAALAAEEYDCGSAELSLLYEILQYKQKALISNLVENVEANLSANGALKLFDGHLRVQYKIGYNACGIKIHDITNAYKNTLLRDTLVVSYFDGENMVDLTYANGGITHAQTPNQHLFVNVPVEYITAPITISFEAPVALDTTDPNNYTYTETVPVTGTYSYAEDAGISAILAINEILAGHENCTCADIVAPEFEKVDTSKLDESETVVIYDNAGIYVYGADDSLTVSYYYGSDLVTLSVGDGIEKLGEYEYYVHGIHAAFLADNVTISFEGVESEYNMGAFLKFAEEYKAGDLALLDELEELLATYEPALAELKADKEELVAAKAVLDAPVLKLNSDWEAAKADVKAAENNFKDARDSYQNFVNDGLENTQMGQEAKAALDAAEAVLAEKQSVAGAAEAAYTAALNELNASANYIALVEDIEEVTEAIAEGETAIANLKEIIAAGDAEVRSIEGAIAEVNEMARYSVAAKAYKVVSE